MSQTILSEAMFCKQCSGQPYNPGERWKKGFRAKEPIDGHKIWVTPIRNHFQALLWGIRHRGVAEV